MIRSEASGLVSLRFSSIFESQAGGNGLFSLERFPIEWSHSIDQKSLKIQKLEHILVDQIKPI
jgi:hypothetical protein